MNGFTGTGTLVRLALRRDRVQLPVWLLALSGVLWASAASVADLYDSEAARLVYATTMASSAATRAFGGPTSGTSLGAIVMTETYTSMAVLIALMSIFAVVRHTRQNEETGRSEMIAAGVVGRYAALTAALVVTVLADLALGVLSCVVLLGVGLPATGSVLAGAALALVGVTFATVAAVTAQVAESSRAANGLASAFLGLAFLARAAGDAAGEIDPGGLSVTSAWPSWFSPLGWGQQTRPFHEDTWWPLVLPVGLSVLLLTVAYLLVTHRDLGTGMLPTRRGPATASRWLAGSLGLAWRLQRTVLFGWATGLLATGIVLGAVADEVTEMTNGNEQMVELLRQLGGAEDLVDAYLGGSLGLCALAVAAYLVQALLRLRGEETAGRLEPILATAVSRSRWLAGHVFWAVLGSAVLLLLTGAGAGLAYGVAVGDVSGQVPRLTGAALVWLPATLALGGFVVAVFGVLPRWVVPLSWTGLGVCLLMGQIGALLELPQVVLDLSPFTHIPAVPAAEVETLPLVVLTVTGLVLATVGLVWFRRRDLAT